MRDLDAHASAESTAERLRAAVLALRQPQAAKRAPAPRSSVYGRAAAAVPADTHPASGMPVLLSRFRAVRTTAQMSGTTMVLVVLPARAASLPDLLAELAAPVRAGATALLLGTDLPRDVPPDRSRPLTVPLRTDDPLGDEWGILACGPAKRVAFLARPAPAAGPGQWEWLLTQDTVAVQRAGTAILERVPFLRLRIPMLAQA